MKSVNGGFYYEKNGLRLQCTKLPDGDLEILTEPKGTAWVGIDNAGSGLEPIKKDHMRLIERYVYHQHSYPGGKRSSLTYGGYDIILIQLQNATNQFKPACLPGPNFDDIRSKEKDTVLAGYGKYFRNKDTTCQTNRFGQMKFHYCDQAFGDGNLACRTDKPIPEQANSECTKFFADPKTPTSVPSSVEEIKIVQKKGGNETFCYPSKNPENQRFGWCRHVVDLQYFLTNTIILKN